MSVQAQLVPEPAVRPFCCIDGSNGGPVIQTGKIIRPYGTIYLSRAMIRDSARLMPELVAELAGEIGWVAPDAHQVALDEAAAHRLDLEGRLAELEPVERALARFVTDEAPVRTRKRAA